MHLQMLASRSPYVFISAPSPNKTMDPHHNNGWAGPEKFCYRQQTGDYGDHMGVAQLMGHEVYDREIGGGGEGGGRENLFEKPLTPSDVGKLNRLVIPKQHAERYFPLNSSQPLEKGMQLSFFEDEEVGKVWQFRYSYWSSSQSYVLTKGWSRFVKEKRLVCGDVVLFQRDRVDGRERLYIGWRRRQPAQSSVAAVRAEIQWDPPFYPNHSPYPAHSAGGRNGGQLRREAPLHAGEPANSKRLRLFGVNLDCPIEQPNSPESNGSNLSEKSRSQLPFSGSSSQA